MTTAWISLLGAVTSAAPEVSVAADTVRFAACEAASLAPRPVEPALRAVYVPMADGVRLATDVMLPKQLAPGEKHPTLLLLTRYWRATEGQSVARSHRFWIDRGYAVVYADVRGTGASFGRWSYPWSQQELDDARAMIDWIVRQPWSDGQVVSTGVSYLGNTAELVAMTGHRAVKAVAPRFSDYDVFAELAFPGGVRNAGLLDGWGMMVRGMDNNLPQGNPPGGVRPVDEDRDRSLLAAAIREHAQNPDVSQASREIVHRDDRPAGWNVAMDDFSAHSRVALLDRAAVPMYVWASWFDAGTADGALRRFREQKAPLRTIIGPWSHGAGHHASQYRPDDTRTDPTTAAQNLEVFCFFEEFVRGGAPQATDRAITYYTVGEEAWKTTKTWPPPGHTPQRWYFHADGVLGREQPREASASDTLRVDPQATTGTRNRWFTQLGGGDVVYGDRAEPDRRLLTFTSAPFAEDVEITGHPSVTLHVTSTARDGAFFVYLEDVDASGKVTYLSEGLLRALHRKVGETGRPSYRKGDAAPLEPGKLATLTFDILPTSVLVRRGHRLRIAISGADRGTFAPIPPNEAPTVTVARSQSRASFVELPVIVRARTAP